MKKTAMFAVAMAAFHLSAAVRTVATGETIVVTDADVASYADGFSFADATGVIEFNTSSAPTMNISGAGTVKKTSSSDWTMTKEIGQFTGTYILEGGGIATVNQNKSTFFGLSASGSPGPFFIKAGNTLDIVNDADWNYLFQNRAVHIAGTGKGGIGAIRTLYAAKSMSTEFGQLILDDDATINLVAKQWFYMNNGSGRLCSSNDTVRTLTIIGSGELQVSGNYKVSTNVSIRATGSSTFTVRDDRAQHDRIAMDSGTTGPVVLEGSATYNIYNLISDVFPYTNRATFAIDRPLTVKGSSANIFLQSRYSVDNDLSVKLDRTRSDINNISGNIVLEEGSKLTTKIEWFGQLQLSGSISGSGDIVMPSANDNRGRLYISGTNDDFSGTITLGNSSYHPMLLLGVPESLPDYSKLKVGSGYVGVDLRYWDVDSVKRLADEADFSAIHSASLAYVGLDTTFWGGNPMPFCYPGSGTAVPVGGCTKGTVLLTNVVTTAEDPLRVMHAGGTMRIVGEGRPIYIGASTKIAHPVEIERDVPPVLEFVNADLRLGTSSPKFACLAQADRALFFTTPRMVISNSTLIAENLRSDYSDVGTDALLVGGLTTTDGFGGGALEIVGNSVISSKVVVAGSATYAKGAVYQRGGSVTALGSPSSWNNSSCIGCVDDNLWTDRNTHGYYELSGGTFKALGRFNIGLGYGASWFQSGGYATLGKALGSDEAPMLDFGDHVDVSTSQSSTIEMYISGGSFDIGDDAESAGIANVAMSGYGSDNKFVQISVDGESALLNLRNKNLHGTQKPASRTMINLVSGGTLQANSIGHASDSAVGIVNFNGGTFRKGAAENIDIFHRTGKEFTRIFVHGGGATIDTQGFDCKTATPLRGVAGQGVTAISLSAPIVGIAFPPAVVIDGDGYGATAVCVYDSKTMTIGSIKVLCPGSGYTEATAKLRWGDNMTIPASKIPLTCTLGDVVNTGSFTKAGEGTFTLGATNTWGGATIVSGGTLKAGCDWAVPTNSPVVLAGGDLDFNGKTGEVASVTYLAGGGSIKNAQNVVVAGAVDMAISTAELAAGKSIDLSDDFDLSGASLRVTGDASALSEGSRYTIVKSTDGTLSGTPSITLDPSFGPLWRVKVRRSRVVLSVQRGMVISVK